MDKIKIVLSGPRGKMGQEAMKMIANEPKFQLVGFIDRIEDPQFLTEAEGLIGSKVPVYTDCETCFMDTKPDVLVDLTTPEIGKKHTIKALEYKVRPVVGTTGFSVEDLEEIQSLSEKMETSCIIAPNFAIGAVLLMKFAEMAVKYMPHAEIIELHHDGKKDAPSGTALKTAQLMEIGRSEYIEKPTQFPAQGLNAHGFQIHSVRLPGLIAHQEVIFGGEGQSLTIRHDSYHRGSFMSGLKISIEKSIELQHFIYGLENLLT